MAVPDGDGYVTWGPLSAESRRPANSVYGNGGAAIDVVNSANVQGRKNIINSGTPNAGVRDILRILGSDRPRNDDPTKYYLVQGNIVQANTVRLGIGRNVGVIYNEKTGDSPPSNNQFIDNAYCSNDGTTSPHFEWWGGSTQLNQLPWSLAGLNNDWHDFNQDLTGTYKSTKCS